MASLENIRPLFTGWGTRQATPPPRLNLSKVTGYYRLSRTIELVKFGGGAEGKIDGFGIGRHVAGGFTAPRPSHEKNADGLLLESANEPGRKEILIAGADGNSGNGGAKVASGEVLNVLGQNFAKGGFNLLRSAKEANKRLDDLKYGRLNIMAGTTLVAALVDLRKDWLQGVHAGESRAYLFRAGQLWLLTRDHNNLADYLAQKASDSSGPAFQRLKELAGRKDPAKLYMNIRFPLINNPQLSELVHDLGLEYRRAKFDHRPTSALTGMPGVKISYFDCQLMKGDWLIELTDGAFNSNYAQLAAAIAANAAKSPYQLTNAIARMLAKNGPLYDDTTIVAYHHG